MVRVNSKATFAVAEAWSIHRERLATRAADYDPFVRARIEAGRTLLAADYMAMHARPHRLVRAMDARLSDLDALVLPTTPIVAPTLAEVASSEGFTRQECAGPAQSGNRQFLRSLRDFTSAATRGRAAGWTDARGTQRAGSQAVPDGGRGRAPVCGLSTSPASTASWKGVAHRPLAEASCSPQRSVVKVKIPDSVE